MSVHEDKKVFPFKKRVSHVIEFAFTMLLFCIINLFPFSMLHSVAKFFRIMLSPLLGSARRRIGTQVSEILKISDTKELRRFTNANIDNTIRSFFELMQAWKMKKKKFIDKYVEIDDEIHEIVADRSQGVVFAEGHFGNWEIPIPTFASMNFRLFFSAQKLSNPYVDAWTHRTRMGYGGGGPIYLREAEKFIPLLRKKEPLGLVADQDAGYDGIFVNFMGKQAATHTGPALLAYLGKARLAVAFCIHQGRGRYKFYAKTLYRYKGKSDFATSREAAQKLTELWVGELEKEIRKYPEQYFWAHRRWKTRPLDETAGKA